MTAGRPCAFGDPFCPCQDGDVCHYVDDPETGTKAMAPPTIPTCSTCSTPMRDPAERWPGEAPGAVICQECWEAECSESWWRGAAALVDLDAEGG